MGVKSCFEYELGCNKLKNTPLLKIKFFKIFKLGSLIKDQNNSHSMEL